MNKPRITSHIIALVWIAFVLAATPAVADEKLTFLTDWKAEAEQGGFYEAAALGLYARHGLDVEIKEGGPSIDPQQLIAAGAVDMAIGSNSFFPLNLLQAGAPVVAVAAMFQKDPQVLMTHPRDDVKSLADMTGKPIMISTSSINTFWVWLKAKYGFTDSQIRPYNFSMAPFLADPSSIQEGYLSSEPFIVKQQGGFDARIFLLADNGYPSYAAMILALKAMVDGKPDVVQGFVDASIEGWYNYLHGDPAPANILIKKDNPDMDDATIAFGIARMKQYGIVDGGDAATLGIGAMTDARWKDFFDTMSRNGVYPANLPYQQAYTLRFVDRKHGVGLKN